MDKIVYRRSVGLLYIII